MTSLTSVGSDMGPKVHRRTFGSVKFVVLVIRFGIFLGFEWPLNPLDWCFWAGSYVKRTRPSKDRILRTSSVDFGVGFSSSNSATEGMSNFEFSG
jgi:hypothetical protein